MPDGHHVALMKSITPDRCQQELQAVGGSDFGFSFGDAGPLPASRSSSNVATCAMVLRQIPNKLLTMEQFGLPEAACTKTDHAAPRLFLVTGPTGSGKSTSLASMINYINETVDHHIITIEDPIEFYHPNKKSTVNQREVGVDVPSFSEALRRALRQDPDVILVGELRDLATIEAAISAAETGHIVFGTLHTTGAQGTVNRIIDVFPTTQQDQIRTQLSTSIIGVLSQALLPKIGGGPHAPRTRCWCGLAGHRQPDPREQDLPHHVGHSDRGQAGHAVLLDDALFKLWKEGKVTKQDVLAKAHSGRRTGRPDRQCRAGRVRRRRADNQATPDGQRQGWPRPKNEAAGI